MDAHYHFHSSIGKRTNGPIVAAGTVDDEIASGQSAVAAVQYALRGGPYRDKASQVVHTASGNMPLWAHVGSGRRRQAGYAYWSACDKYERANGVLFVAIDIALPDQLPEFSRVAVAIRLAYLLAATAIDIGHPMPWSLVVHRKPDDDGRLHDHAHLILSLRCNDGVDRTPESWFRRANRKHQDRGGARKTRIFQAKKWLVEARKLWEKVGNAALMKAACLERLDCRSHRERRIDRLPGIHLGPLPTALRRDGKSSRRLKELQEIEQENAERASLVRARAELEARRRRADEQEILATLIESCGDDLAELLGDDFELGPTRAPSREPLDPNPTKRRPAIG